MREEIQRIQQAMEREGYVTDRAVATAVHLSMALGKPLLVEGHPGVGKTEIAKVLAVVLAPTSSGCSATRASTRPLALYEWNYPKQLLHIRLEQDGEQPVAAARGGHLQRAVPPQAAAARTPSPTRIAPPVLLIDEVDRADEEFEAFLLEVLSRFPGDHPGARHGARRARPVRRPHLEPHPRALGRARAPLPVPLDRLPLAGEGAADRPHRASLGIDERLAREVTAFIHSLRRMKLAKVPGVAESLDWAQALVALHATHLDEELVRETLGCFLKDEEDLRTVSARLDAGELAALSSPVA